MPTKCSRKRPVSSASCSRRLRSARMGMEPDTAPAQLGDGGFEAPAGRFAGGQASAGGEVPRMRVGFRAMNIAMLAALAAAIAPGTQAPAFSLESSHGKQASLDGFK